jgi:hypothetical protein
MQIQWSCENSRHPQKIRTSKRRWFVAAAIAPPETSFSSQSFSLSLSLSLSLAYLLPCSHLSTSLKCNLSKRIGSYVKERLSQKPRSGPVQDLSYGDLDLSGNQKPAPQLFPRTIYVRSSHPSGYQFQHRNWYPRVSKSLNASWHPTAVTETFICPVTTQSRGSLLVCTSQMADLEPPVLP